MKTVSVICNTSHFVMYQFVKYIDNYHAARSKLSQAEETSTLETDADEEAQVRRKERKNRHVAMIESESETSPMKKRQKVKKVAKQLLPMPIPPTITGEGE
jgi:hypothetical protein